ncbi:cyclin-J18, partial [Nymphaea colorata]
CGISTTKHLRLSPIVKYTALSLFADRFLFSFQRLIEENYKASWLLQPMDESNLQLFALISIWISSKMHDVSPLSVRTLKSLADVMISDQHFTARDFIEAEMVFMKVLRFEIGAANIAFFFLEELLYQFREIAKVGDSLKLSVCMDIMDLLYEDEGTSLHHYSPRSLAASILIAAYVLTIPRQPWEFPVFPWVMSMDAYQLEDIEELVRFILHHTLKPCEDAGFSYVKGDHRD